MRNAFFKDILRDLRRTFGRFFGMFAIVGLGVFVFAGLGSTGSLMKEIGDRYYREHNFFGIHVISTFGLSEKDLEALRRTPGVESVAGACNLDAVVSHGGAQLTVRAHSLELGADRASAPNRPDLLSGRYPEKGNEALVEPALLQSLGLSLGDTLVLESGKTSDIRTRLRTDSFRIVGTVQSPLYFSSLRGSSSVGSGQTDCYLLLPAESFRQSAYSEAYVTVEGGSGLFCYGDPYKERIDEVIDRIKGLGDLRIPLRKREVTGQRWTAVHAAQSRLAGEREAAFAELDAADRRLAEELAELSQSQAQLGRMEDELADQRALLELSQAEQEQNLRELDGAIATLRSSEERLGARRSELEEGQTGLYGWQAELAAGKTSVQELDRELEEGVVQVEEGILELDEGLERLEAGLAELALSMTALREQLEAASDPEEIALLQIQLEALEEEQAQLTATKGQLTDTHRSLMKQLELLLDQKPALLEAFHALRRQRGEMNRSQQELLAARQQLDSGLAALTALRQTLEAQRLEVEEGLVSIDELFLELDVSAQSLEQNRIRLTRGESALRQGERSLAVEREAALASLERAQDAIRWSRRQLRGLDDPKWYVLDRNSNLSYGSYSDEAEQIHEIGRIIPLLFFLVAALVSLTTMTRLVEEQRTGMGAYLTLGYSGGKILSKYLFFAFAPTFLGSLAGGYLGFQVFPVVILIQAYGGMFSFPPFESTINLRYWAAGLLLAVLTTSLTTLSTCLKELRAAPAGLMRPRAPKLGKKTPLEHITPLWRRLSFLYKVTFRNIFRYKKRLFMTLAGVGGSAALLLAGLGLNDSLAGMVETQFRVLSRYDLEVGFADGISSGSLQSTRRGMAEHPAVVQDFVLRREPVEAHRGDGDTRDALLAVPQQEEVGDFILLRERVGHRELRLPPEGAIINERLANGLELEPGDRFILRDGDDNEFSVEVAAVCEAYLGNYVYMSGAYYEQVFGEAPVHNAVYAKRMAGATPAETSQLSDWLLDRSGVASVTLIDNQVRIYNDMIAGVNGVVVLIIFVAGLLAFVVLINLTNINIVERAREIATIEVLGFRDGEVASYIYRENILVSFGAALLGILPGRYLHGYICRSIEGASMMMMRRIAPLSYLLAVALTMVFTLSVALMTKGKLRNINMIEALKSME